MPLHEKNVTLDHISDRRPYTSPAALMRGLIRFVLFGSAHFLVQAAGVCVCGRR
ncbi:hypothetical protein [Paenibacillus polymyxa]|uniref:Uncharacterized protein n=1 Tax=Paenibacillus polymyxa TaxID=1406 RepID=A0AAP4EBH7_PAEPO|nr:hypothetical protein [Paenibacillus polymyxa]MDH2332463.1 hypothetical protein [Paenibacillus polymyxa]